MVIRSSVERQDGIKKLAAAPSIIIDYFMENGDMLSSARSPAQSYLAGS